MSLLQYGPLSLNLIKVNFYKRTAVYSGPNYLYHRHHLSIRAYLNPGTQDNYIGGDAKIVNGSYGKPIVPNVNVQARPAPNIPRIPAPGFQPGSGGTVPGVSSDKAIRHELMQPRQRLIYSILGEPILISPAQGFTVDVTGGPMPLACNVEKIGPRTFVVDFEIQTDVNETTLFLGENQLPYILGQSWTMEHIIDDRWFTARIIEGRVTFRQDLLTKKELFDPDDFRNYIMHPLPIGFKRESVQVRAEEDNCTLRYKIIDRQWPIWWSNPFITKVEFSHQAKVSEKGAYEFMREGSWGLSGYLSTLPLRVGVIKAKAWVQPGDDCQVAASFAKLLTWNRFKAILTIMTTRAKSLSGRSWEFGIEAHENSGYSIMSYTAPTDGEIWQQAIDLPEQLATTTAVVAGAGGTLNILDLPTKPVAPLPASGGTRGTYLETVIGSALQAPFVSPKLPPEETLPAAVPPPILTG